MAHKSPGFTLLEFLIVIAISALLTALAYDFHIERTERISLKADEWQCVQTQERDFTESIWSGKLNTERTGRRVECVEWLRRG